MTGSLRWTMSAFGCLLAMMVADAVPAPAADLGGNCCADLEARVTQLQETVVTKGNRRVSLEVTGRVNTNIMWFSDNSAGTDAGVAFDAKNHVYFGNTGDNQSHVVLRGSGTVSPDITAGFLMTVETEFGGVDTQTSTQSSGVLTSDTTYVFLKSAKWGEYRLGDLPSASDDAYYVDYGAPGTVGGLAGERFVGPFHLRASKPFGVLTDVTYGHVIGELADTNQSRLMYLSPTWNGFSYKSDIGEGTGSALLSWTGSHGGWRGAAAAGYQLSTGQTGVRLGGIGFESNSITAFAPTPSTAFAPLTDAAHNRLRQVAISGSVLEDRSGLFVTGEYSRAYADIAGRNDAQNWFARAGWIKNVTGLGATVIDAQYERTLDKLSNGTSAHLWGGGIDQAIDSIGGNVYLHYQHDSFDTDGAVTAASSAPAVNECGGAGCVVNGQSIDTVTAGMLVNF